MALATSAMRDHTNMHAVKEGGKRNRACIIAGMQLPTSGHCHRRSWMTGSGRDELHPLLLHVAVLAAAVMQMLPCG